MENGAFDNVEMTAKKAEAEGEDSPYSEVNDAEQGTSKEKKARSPCTKPYAGMGKEDLLRFSQTPGWRAARWVCLLIILAGWCTMLAMAIYLIVTTPRCLPWWQSAVVYQVFPRSFQDAAVGVEGIGGDGIGDLRGIIDHVDYFQSLGIGAVMLSSIFKSGGMDNGEDIMDFTEVDSDLGTLDDFLELVGDLHDADIKLILDFIPNHSSYHHEFFNESMKVKNGDSDAVPEYQDYYKWTDNKPNNWSSLYSGSAWNCEEVPDNCFLHQYSKYQPDFDLTNEAVLKHLSEALETWFTRGVDGFNIRGVQYFYEARNLVAANEPANPDFVENDSDLQQYDETLHYYTSEYSGKSHELLREWKDDLFYKFSTSSTYRVMLTDSTSNTSYVQSYYGTNDDPEADLPMNFNLLQIGGSMGEGGEITGRALESLIKDWMEEMHEDNWPNFQLGNYGASRIASRLSPAYSKVANILLLTLPGTPICYYGDEIGMENLPVTELDFNQSKDQRGLSDPDVWQEKTRDFGRSPMQWNATANAGFSRVEESEKLYLPVHSGYQQVNVKAQEEDKSSVLHMFRALTMLRSEYRALTSNKIKFIASSDEVIAYVRELDDQKERFFISLNFGKVDSEIDYFHTAIENNLPLQGSVVVATAAEREGSRVELNKLHLAAGEGVVVLLDEVVRVGGGWWYKYFMPEPED